MNDGTMGGEIRALDIVVAVYDALREVVFHETRTVAQELGVATFVYLCRTVGLDAEINVGLLYQYGRPLAGVRTAFDKVNHPEFHGEPYVWATVTSPHGRMVFDPQGPAHGRLLIRVSDDEAETAFVADQKNGVIAGLSCGIEPRPWLMLNGPPLGRIAVKTIDDAVGPTAGHAAKAVRSLIAWLAGEGRR